MFCKLLKENIVKFAKICIFELKKETKKAGCNGSVVQRAKALVAISNGKI